MGTVESTNERATQPAVRRDAAQHRMKGLQPGHVRSRELRGIFVFSGDLPIELISYRLQAA